MKNHYFSIMKWYHLSLSLLITFAFISLGVYFHSLRPHFEQRDFAPSKEHIRASGKCTECHRRETSSIVHQFERSRHVKAGINCLDCHQNLDRQESISHKGFTLTKKVTAKNCASCHTTEYNQFVKSRHGGSAWGAVRGHQDFSAKQIEMTEKYHPQTVLRGPNKLALLEGEGAIKSGCMGCHSIGKPNKDGSIGNCTECHSAHRASVAMARQPETCAQCHMGPDHSQYEIYSESKHGAMFNAFKGEIKFDADPKNLTTRDFPIPTCATCHMSGLEGLKVTHDVSKRLSWYLFAPVSKKRPHFQQGRDEMQETCLKCHAKNRVEGFYKDGDIIVKSTNEIIKESQELIKNLRKDKLLTPNPFDEDIEFLAFDIWHYYGRTAKHGAFMGGADFVQWHGQYELLRKMVKLKALIKKVRNEH